MKFYATWRVYNTRYGAGFTSFLSMCAWMALYPIALGKEFMFLELFKGIFLTDIRITSMVLIIILFAQVNLYFASSGCVHILEIKDHFAVFNLFSFRKDKIVKFNYSELKSLELTKDVYENFEFTLKSGEKKVILVAIKNKQQAFDLINQKIREAT